ncbi:phage tail protein [Streptomyces daliensis]|uniref:Phage tail protein n=1 Tax=Streptomyces daliensis TaxID=299421 RepID=A0A8T4IQ33_9ACTN|nr:phage tail protein [Streptomyces daliensis]
MSRGAVPGLPSRHPIGALLPALYAEDDFAQRFTGGLDTLLAPVFSTLDNLPAYFDPRLAPEDFLTWVASWVGIRAEGPERPDGSAVAGGGVGPSGRAGGLSREAVAHAVELHRWRGTRRGLVELLRLSLGVETEIEDGGGVSWSSETRSELPPAPATDVLVRVRAPDGGGVDEARVRALVEAVCPVHLTCRVEILSGPSGSSGGEGS